MNKRLVVFTRYRDSYASTRLRISKFIPQWKDEGWDVYVHTLFDDKYDQYIYKKKISFSFARYLVKRYWSRLRAVSGTKKKDIVLIQYEILPFFPAWLEYYLKWRGIKYVLDFDDAFFHNYDGSSNLLVKLLLKNKFSTIVKLAGWITTGSPYLTQYALQRNQCVTEIPTGVEFSRYDINVKTDIDKTFTIGWIGSPYTSKYVDDISVSLKKFLTNHYAKLLLVGYTGEVFNNSDQIIIYNWSEATEVSLLHAVDVGIMPLRNDAFSKGKCGFKLIQYMACGKPTIATPLDANLKIDGGNGNLFASTENDWVRSLEEVFSNRQRYKEVGLRNKAIVKQRYNLEKNHLLYSEIFKLLKDQ